MQCFLYRILPFACLIGIRHRSPTTARLSMTVLRSTQDEALSGHAQTVVGLCASIRAHPTSHRKGSIQPKEMTRLCAENKDLFKYLGIPANILIQPYESARIPAQQRPCTRPPRASCRVRSWVQLYDSPISFLERTMVIYSQHERLWPNIVPEAHTEKQYP